MKKTTDERMFATLIKIYKRKQNFGVPMFLDCTDSKKVKLIATDCTVIYEYTLENWSDFKGKILPYYNVCNLELLDKKEVLELDYDFAGKRGLFGKLGNPRNLSLFESIKEALSVENKEEALGSSTFSFSIIKDISEIYKILRIRDNGFVPEYSGSRGEGLVIFDNLKILAMPIDIGKIRQEQAARRKQRGGK